MKYVVVYRQNPDDVIVFGLFATISEAEGWIAAQPRPRHYYVQPLNKVK